MISLLKNLTNLSIVSNVLQNPAQYPSTSNGFKKDRQKLQSDVNRVTSTLNRNVNKYGSQKYSN